MLIVGAKGFAKEIVQIFLDNGQFENIVFYDDVSSDLPPKLFDKYPIITDIQSASKFLNSTDGRFTIGVGKPVLRKRLYERFNGIGGVFTSSISKYATVGSFDVEIGKGCNILSGARISNAVSIGVGCIVYYNCSVTHDCIIGDFVEISPSANILGRVSIGNYTHIGANATILPDIQIGMNVIVGAGAVVSKNVQDNTVVAGVPARKLRELPPTEFS